MFTLEFWKKRATKKIFWLAFISQLIVLCELLGIDLIAMVPILGQYEDLITVLFAILATLGIPVDTKTEGFSDKPE